MSDLLIKMPISYEPLSRKKTRDFTDEDLEIVAEAFEKTFGWAKWLAESGETNIKILENENILVEALNSCLDTSWEIDRKTRKFVYDE